MKQLSLILVLVWSGYALQAQEKSWENLPFTDMTAFKSQAGNWFVVGEVRMDPTLDIHHDTPKETTEATTSKSKKSRKKRNKKTVTPTAAPPKAVTYTPGTGILLNMNDKEKRTNLQTQWEHGDIVLDFEVMMPKGSNSGVYFQGRYEVQLYDSWGQKKPSFTDIGGIYQNWGQTPETKYLGKAPSTNAAKAPGLWQHFKIAFQAPKFDAQGKKISPAKFLYVDLNGIRIHENLEVPLPTGGAIGQEAPKGPLMIQGDHGPVAFRNFRYQLLEDRGLMLKNISYKMFPGKYDKFLDFGASKASKEGTLDQISLVQPEDGSPFRTMYKGEIVVPEAGIYTLNVRYNSQIAFRVGQQKMIKTDHQSPWNRSVSLKKLELSLNAGANPFLMIIGNITTPEPRIGLFSTDAFERPLQSLGAFPPFAPSYSPIYVSSAAQPKLLRAFLDFKGQRSQRLTHTIGVASPHNIHYIYDLKTANPVCVWQGEFIDATPMWNNRGDGSFRPRGAAQYLFTGLSIAHLSGLTEAFPREMNETQGFKNKGYKVNKDSGFPTFLYALDSLEIEDQLLPDDNAKSWKRNLTFNTTSEGLYLKLAEGSTIQQIRPGYYAIDQQYYIKIADQQNVQTRTLNGQQELIVPVASKSISYSILW